MKKEENGIELPEEAIDTKVPELVTTIEVTEKFGFKEFMKTLAVSFVFVLLLTNFVIKPIRVNGSSMYPSLKDKEIGFSNILSYKVFGAKRFDVVIVYVDELKEYLVKRVIGLPGEIVEFKNDTLYIDNKAISQPFLSDTYMNSVKGYFSGIFTNSFGPVILGDDEVWLMGDNRPYSSDSRRFGAFKLTKIISKDAYILFPLNEAKIVAN